MKFIGFCIFTVAIASSVQFSDRNSYSQDINNTSSSFGTQNEDALPLLPASTTNEKKSKIKRLVTKMVQIVKNDKQNKTATLSSSHHQHQNSALYFSDDSSTITPAKVNRLILKPKFKRKMRDSDDLPKIWKQLPLTPMRRRSTVLTEMDFGHAENDITPLLLIPIRRTSNKNISEAEFNDLRSRQYCLQCKTLVSADHSH